MSLETIVAPLAAALVSLPAVGLWVRRHVRLHGEIGVTIKLGDKEKSE